MTREQMEKIAASAASEWCRCFKCDGIINETGDRCDKPRSVTCWKYRDGYKTALIALEKAERQGVTLEGWVQRISRDERGDKIELWMRPFALDPIVEAFGGPEAFMKSGFDINMQTYSVHTDGKSPS